MDNVNSENKKTVQGQSMAANLYDLFEVIIVSLISVFIIFAFIARVAVVDGASMDNTLKNGDKLLVWELFYKPEQGDIIVCQSNFSNKEPLVKRVIATEGQTVRIDSAAWEVYVDGKLIDENYVNYVEGRDMGSCTYGDEFTVPEGKIFVMGDNRSISRDSRSASVGFIDVDWVMGKAIFRYAPFSKIGTI